MDREHPGQRHEWDAMTVATISDQPDSHPAAFNTVLLSVSPSLRRFALRLTKDHSAADDLVQDTLVRAWAARARFEPGSNAKAWLFRIARNSFISGLRRARRHVRWDPDRHETLLVQAAMQDDALYARDLRAALSRLPTPQYDALLAVGPEGLSIDDAAYALGIPSGTVQSRVRRARASILAYFERDIFEEKGGPSDCPVGANPIRAAPAHGDKALSVKRPGLSLYEQWKASGATMIG